MRRLAIALLLALYIALAPFALQGQPLAVLTAAIALASILFLVRCLARPKIPASEVPPA